MSKQSKKKKMSNRKYLGIMVPVISFLLVLTLAANIAADAFSNTIEMWFNGSGASFHSEDALTARAHAKEVAEQLQAEGVVLLKNTDNSEILNSSKWYSCEASIVLSALSIVLLTDL